ncbi:MAG: winged helix DNA-binding domain-containing protein, partial [Flavobacteriales bacterium]
MTTKDIALVRVENQWIGKKASGAPEDVVRHMCAMQAQDLGMSKWAVGIRALGITEEDVTAAMDRGDILRTHVLRPTWHLVAKEDIRWMLELTAPRIKRAMLSNGARRGLDEKTFKRSNAIIEKALSAGKHLTRAELQTALEKAKLPTDDNRLSHMLMHAELDGIMCSGVVQSKRTTHALLEERAAKKEKIGRDEALERLATRYYTSHGPATLKDFVWWSGLTMTDAKRGMDAVRSSFSEEQIGESVYLLPGSVRAGRSAKTSLHLLPAFDEFIIGYADRSAVLASADQRRAYSSNGMFYPVLLRDGKGIGLWKRMIVKQQVEVEIDPFKKLGKAEMQVIDKAASAFGVF